MHTNKATKDNYESIVYISHEHQGTSRGVKAEIEHIIRKLQQKYPNYMFISPVHTFGFLYTDINYGKGLQMALFLLDNCCDEMWYVPSGTSRSVKAEIEYCQQYGIPYRKIVRGKDY